MDLLTILNGSKVINVIRLSVDLVGHSYSIYKSADGTLAEFREVETLTKDLKDCNWALSQYLKRVDSLQPRHGIRPAPVHTLTVNAPLCNAHDGFTTPDEEALAGLCKGCNEIAGTLLAKLDRLKCRPGASGREWNAARQAFRSLWTKSEIDAMNSRLRGYREQLNTRLLVLLRDQLDRNTTLQDGRLETLEHSASRILSTLLENRQETSADIEMHATRLLRSISAENEKTRELLKAYLAQSSTLASGLEAPTQTQATLSAPPSPQPSLSPSSAPPSRHASPLTSNLFDAAKSGDMRQIRSLLRSPQTNIDELDEVGRSPLHIACMNRHVEVAKYLARKGADVNGDDDTGATPLHYAVQTGDAALVRTLLSRHARVDFVDDEGRTAADYAPDIFLIKWMLKFGYLVNAQDPSTESTALMEAAKMGDQEAAKFLLDQGANANAQCYAKNTALHNACNGGHLACVELLVSHGANLELRDKDQRTPLIIATIKGHLAVVEHLVAAGADLEARSEEERITPLFHAIFHKNWDILQHLLEKGALIEARDDVNYTPLTRAGQSGLLDGVRILLDHGANIDLAGSDGWRCLNEAAYHNFLAIVDLLIARGANIQCRNNLGDTPLTHASMQGNTEIVRLLLAHNADVNAYNKQRMTSLHEACWYGYADIVEMLLDAGADMEMENDRRLTPLGTAVENMHSNCAKLLLDRGANPEALARFREEIVV